MSFSDIEPYLVPLFVGLVIGWRIVKFRRARSLIPQLLAQGAVVVDVRSREEFRQGARPGSLNIPVGELPSRLNELDPEKPTIVCCASGGRSGMAAGLLKSHGFKQVINAGPWRNTL